MSKYIIEYKITATRTEDVQVEAYNSKQAVLIGLDQLEKDYGRVARRQALVESIVPLNG